MTVLAGLFLIAHGLVHLAIWLPPPAEDAPFDPRRSWLVGEASRLTRALAIAACVLLAVAGVLLLAGSAGAAAAAIAGAVVSVALVLLAWNRWFVFAIAINVAIVAVALS